MSNFPEVLLDQNGHYLPHILSDYEGRKKTAYGTISRYRNGGSNINNGLRNWIIEVGEWEDDGGHIIPRCLFGSGRDKDNMFPQNKVINRIIGRMENEDKEDIKEENLTVQFKYTFYYFDPIAHQRPTSFHQEVWWRNKTGVLMRHFKRKVWNPTFSECSQEDSDTSRYIELVFDHKRPNQNSMTCPQQSEAVLQSSSSSQQSQQEGYSWGQVAAGVALGGAIFAGLMGAFGSSDSSSTASKKNETERKINQKKIFRGGFSLISREFVVFQWFCGLREHLDCHF